MGILAVRVQEKGQVTIPLEIRRKLNLKKGDLVTFTETEGGVLIKPVEVIDREALAAEALEDIGRALRDKGLDLQELIEQGRQIREKLIEEEYGLTENDVS